MTKCLKSKKVKIIFLFSVFYFLISVFSARAASFSFNPQDLTIGKETAVILSVDTENQEINAIEMRLKFSGDNFLVKDISDGNSIVSLWVEKPVFSGEKGEIYFSGIIPGGFQGISGRLLKIILIPQKTGEASFEITEEKVLLNDGLGTPTDVKNSNFQFSISKQIPDSTFYFPDSKKDIDPPEAFASEIASDSNIFGGEYFLAFATQDKGLGIDHYEISEGNRPFIIAESPYLLRNQKLDEEIKVKAVDKAGNERVEIAPAKNPKKKEGIKTDDAKIFFAILLIIILILVFFVKYIYNKRRNQRNENTK